jgi:diguanylate cyclase (GGDEF)-like protein
MVSPLAYSLSHRRPLLLVAIASFLASFACMSISSKIPEASHLSSAFLFLLEGTFLAFCWFRYRSSSGLRLQWALLSLAALLRSSSYLADTLDGVVSRFFPGSPDWTVTYTDLVSFFALIPFLLLISLPSGQLYPKLFFWIDAVQATLAGYLAYATLFGFMPFVAQEQQPSDADLSVSYHRIAVFYTIVAILLACATVMRFLASTDLDEVRFYRVQAICASISMGLSLWRYAYPMSNIPWLQGMAVAPVLISCWLIGKLPAESAQAASSEFSRPLTRALNLASPAIFSVSLMGLGLYVSRHRFFIGAAFATCSILLYCMRSSTLQIHYEQTQRSLQNARDKLEELSLRDSLTEVANRRCFDLTFRSQWHLAVREGHPLSVLLIDIDFFKQLNDRDGHMRGDECLIVVARSLASALVRPADLLARYGGEEFIAMLPGADATGAQNVAARMQESINQLRITHETEVGLFLSVSIGIATHTLTDDHTEQSLIRAADTALYKAKSLGRNRFVLAEKFVQSDIIKNRN